MRNKPVSVARRQLIHVGVLPPKQSALMRALRFALTRMSDGVRNHVAQPQAFYNAGDATRSCPTDRLALMIDQACDAVAAQPGRSSEEKLEQLLALPRTIEAHIRARLAPAPALSPKEHALRVSRTDAAEDMTLAEYLANPNDPSTALRAAEMAEVEAREKLGWATQVRAFFHRHHPRTA